jgi:hypothetical protein
MRTTIAVAVVAGLLVPLSGAASAEGYRNRHARHEGYSHRYPSATERQLRNLRGYERGGYYEHLSTALPFGSKAWWEQRSREGGRRF